MLYEIAHIIKERSGFVWDMVEWGNATVFSLMKGNAMKKIPSVLKECSDKYEIRLAEVTDVDGLVQFFAKQPEASFTFVKPHEFDAKVVKKVVKNKAFLTFVVMDKVGSNGLNGSNSLKGSEGGNHSNSSNISEPKQIVGYFFLRCFVNGKAFRGKMVDKDHQRRGIAKLMGVAMTKVATTLGVRMFGSISPENYASLASAKASNEVKIHKMLENGYYYIEFMEKK